MTSLILALGAGGLAVCLAGEGLQRFPLRAVGKVVASTGFLALAAARGVPSDTVVGVSAWAALALGWLGDVALLSSDKRGLLAGIGLFLAGHLGWTVAWGAVGVDLTSALLGAGAVGVALAGVWRWLSPHLTKLRGPVIAYFAVSALMVTVASGAAGHTGQGVIAGAAAIFALSDVFVARQRFVVATPWNRYVGLPLYYAAQYAFAWTAAAM